MMSEGEGGKVRRGDERQTRWRRVERRIRRRSLNI